MIKHLSAAVLALALLAGCGGSESPDKEAAPPPKVYTAAQLQAALPEVKEIPEGKELTTSCPGDKTCVEPEDGMAYSRGFSLKLPFTGADAERAASTGVADLVDLTVTQHTSAVAASTALTGERKKMSAYDGAFEEKAKKSKDGFIFGLKGSGALKEATVTGWSGFFSERDIKLTNLDGGDEGVVRDNQLHVVRGAVTVQVRVVSGQGDRSLDECEKIARAVAKDYLDRLG